MNIFQIVSLIFFSFSCIWADTLQIDIQDYESPYIPYKKQFITLLSENDTYANQYVDRYYTAGTALSYVSKEYIFGYDNKSKTKWINYLSLINQAPKITRFNVGLLQDIYTPFSRASNPPALDHLYGAYLRMNFGISQRTKTLLENVTLSLGVVGPFALGYETQKLIHQLTHNPMFYGWKHQIKNEFILNFNYQLIKKIHLFSLPYFSSDILPALEIGLGNADTHFSIGSRVRLGYNLDSDFGVNKINTGFKGMEPYNDSLSFYVFGGIFGRYQTRNIFIQGNSFANSTKTELNYFVYESEMGIALLYQGARLSYTYTHTSKTFKSQVKAHNFGAIEITIAF